MSATRSIRPLTSSQSARSRVLGCASIPLAFAAVLSCPAQTMKAPDITRDPTLYVVPYAHLDTQWRWEMPQTISEYLLKTMRVNFDYIDRYPHYVFNWTGSNRYRLMKEYFPDDYARMTRYVAQGRWFPAGSSVEEGDVNLPSAEGIFRQILYGNEFFRDDFGKASNEYMLPDCFGFPASLPTILSHAGVKGFSTQKLSATWQPAPQIGGPGSPEHTPEGIPFNVGNWVGPDGSKVLAALNPSSYNSNVYTDLSRVNPPYSLPDISQTELEMLTPQQRLTLSRWNERQEPNWVDRIHLDGEVTGVYADYHYVGTGDIGGATEESTVKLLEAIVTRQETVLPPIPLPGFLKGHTPAPAQPVQVGTGPVHVIESTADQMFNDIGPALTARMPEYRGDLELINHSAGSLTSQAYHKRWVIKNELLADAAEKASVAAAWMGGLPYPQTRMRDAWTLALGGHFHDTAAGTATPQTYQFAWNDDILVANQFAGVFRSATQSIASALDTNGPGVPIVLFNALNISREDLVEAAVPDALKNEKALHVVTSTGTSVPAQVQEGKLLFSAKAPSVGYAVYHVVSGSAPASGDLKVTASSLENARYRVAVNAEGDVSSIFDKSLNKELLASPIRLELTTDTPRQYPAWNMDYDQVEAPPRAYIGGPAQIRIKENGPVRVALEITRESEGSRYVQTVSLSTGDAGNRVEFANAIDWRGKAENLKVAFPLTANNPNATYNEDIGTLERPNAQQRQFEVFSHRWIDLTDKSGDYGVTILTDCKNGSDKPADNILRLTLLRTPGLQALGSGYSDQANQDWGHHEFTFGLAGHAAGWRAAGTDWQGYRLNDPLRAFTTSPHPGSLGKTFSLLQLDNARVRVLALKKAEKGDEIVVRLAELDGKAQPRVALTFPAPVASAREINAQEQPLGDGHVEKGVLVTSFGPYQPRTFALRLAQAPHQLTPVASQPLPLSYDLAAASNDDTKTTGGGFDGNGDALPAEMLPASLAFQGVDYSLAPAATGKPDALTASGQTLALPAGSFNRIYVLAASKDNDQLATFQVGSRNVSVPIQKWGGFVGQWDTRLWKNEPKRDWSISAHHAAWPPADLKEREARLPSSRYPEDYTGLREGFVKPADVAWYASHIHNAEGLNQPYRYSYLFSYALDLPQGSKTLKLPNAPGVRILAVSAVRETPSIVPLTPLYDTLKHTEEPTTTE